MSDVNTELINAEIENNSEMKGKYLTFWTDSQLFGIPIAEVVQIVKVQEITEIPDFPLYAKGIINLRGTIIPVIDVRLRLHKEEADYSERTCIIVTNINEVYIGFIVDNVDEVTDIDDVNISVPPKISDDYSNTFITGIGTLDNKVILLIDVIRLINDDDFLNIKSSIE